jgi:hypothetical protein
MTDQEEVYQLYKLMKEGIADGETTAKMFTEQMSMALKPEAYQLFLRVAAVAVLDKY